MLFANITGLIRRTILSGILHMCIRDSVYTVEGNSGDACKIKSYDLNYQCIKRYGLMNW